MAKFYGPVGYIVTEETKPGVWTERKVERNYSGDFIRHSSRWTASQDSTNDDMTINGQISIVADPFANNYFHSMKYVEFMGTKWKITGVDPQFPRLILTIGGVYNG